MAEIGGNTSIYIQKKTSEKRNALGQLEHEFETVQTLTGFLDMSGGETGKQNYNSLMQESTHIFICDYKPVKGTTSDSRVIDENGNIYQLKYIDDPMGLHQHLEIYLKYVGGGQVVK